MVSQAVKYSSILLPICAVWLSLVLDLLPGFRVTNSPWKEVVLVVPVFAVFAFGIYCLISLYLQVIRFQDRPDEAESLSKEIQVARADLRKRGVKID